MNGQDIRAVLESIQETREIDCLELGGLDERAFNRCLRIPGDDRRRVPPGDFSAVQIGHETVVIFEAQGEGVEGGLVVHLERNPHIGARVHAEHVVREIGGDQSRKALQRQWRHAPRQQCNLPARQRLAPQRYIVDQPIGILTRRPGIASPIKRV